MRPPPSAVRTLAWIASGVALGSMIGSAWGAWRVDAEQGWSAQGLGWLVLDHLARHPAPGAGALGGLLGLALSRTLVAHATGPGVRRVLALPGRAFVAVVLLALAFPGPRWLARATRPSPGGAPDLLVVLVDTWRADRAGFLGCPRALTPGLDRLAREGVVFERAEAQASWTKPSVATLLTGQMPSRHGAFSEPLPPPARGTDLGPAATTLLEVLRARGWQTAMWSNNPHVVPARGFDQGAERFFDYVHHPARTFEFDPGTAARMLPEVAAWLARERDTSRPVALYVHLLDPHAPYAAPPEFRGRFASESPASAPAHPCDAYDEEILSVDAALGPFLAEVLARSPDTVVVLCSDHGEELEDHGAHGHGHTLYEELTHVPLVLWAPELAPARVHTQVRLLDVLPTLLELTGNGDAIPARVQGESLLPVIRGEETADRQAPAESGGDGRPLQHWRSLNDGRWKLLLREVAPPGAVRGSPDVREVEPPPWVRLFDLQVDPGELHSLHAERPEEVHALFEEMRAQGWYVSPEELLGAAPEAGVDAKEDRELLRELGYGGAGEGD